MSRLELANLVQPGTYIEYRLEMLWQVNSSETLPGRKFRHLSDHPCFLFLSRA